MTLKTTKIIGTELLTKAIFKDKHNEVFVPTVVNLIYIKPNLLVVTESFTGNISNEFSKTLLLDMAGNWKFRWECTGANASADEFVVLVEDTIVK